jgi:hypothetical protein
VNFARLGFTLFSLALLSTRLSGADAPATLAATERAPFHPAATPPAASPPISNSPAHPTAVARDHENDETKMRAIIRNAIRESFRYEPGAYVRAKPPEHSSPALLAPQSDLDPAVVVMSKFEVTARPYDHGLAAAIRSYQDPRPVNNRKFGTGTYQKDFGKVRMTTQTIFYIPFFFGLSW